MADYIVRATAAGAAIRAFAITSRDLVETARQDHNTSPIMTAALGRLLSGGAMMGTMLKGEKDLLTLQIQCSGPARGLTVTADANGHVKGFVNNPIVELPPNKDGHLNVGGALDLGILSVIKDMGLKEPYSGQTMLQTGEIAEDLSLVHNVIVQNTCCRRAFIRGAFLAAGSISDPEKFYHFEITCASMGKAKQLQGLMASFGIDARIVLRKRYFVVYVKEGSQIVDLLNIMEAPVALMELENIRIVKEMRNTVNRKVNCETANINKTVSAAVKQMEDIRYICDTVGLESLPDNLKEMAKMRLERPEATLKELGEALEPPVGKSGVNHRLRKLSMMAQDIRERS